MPEKKLEFSNSDHSKILDLIKTIRKDWLNMYEYKDNKSLTEEEKESILRNKTLKNLITTVWEVYLKKDAIEDVFYGLPVRGTKIDEKCTPNTLKDCGDDMAFLVLLCKLEDTYRKKFKQLETR